MARASGLLALAVFAILGSAWACDHDASKCRDIANDCCEGEGQGSCVDGYRREQTHEFCFLTAKKYKCCSPGGDAIGVIVIILLLVGFVASIVGCVLACYCMKCCCWAPKPAPQGIVSLPPGAVPGVAVGAPVATQPQIVAAKVVEPAAPVAASAAQNIDPSVLQFLQGLGLQQYAGKFAEQSISADMMKDLTDDDLKGLGLVLGERKKFIAAQNSN